MIKERRKSAVESYTAIQESKEDLDSIRSLIKHFTAPRRRSVHNEDYCMLSEEIDSLDFDVTQKQENQLVAYCYLMLFRLNLIEANKIDVIFKKVKLRTHIIFILWSL